MALQYFLTFQQAADRLGGPEAVRQSILTHDLQAYVELNETITHDRDVDGEDISGSGATKFASWLRSSRWRSIDPYAEFVDPEDAIESVYYSLSGWFTMRPPDAWAIARNNDINAARTLYLVPAQDDGSEGILTPEYFEVSHRVTLEKLYFRTAGIDELLSNERVGGTVAGDGSTRPGGQIEDAQAHENRARSIKQPTEIGSADSPRSHREREPATYLPVIQVLEKSAHIQGQRDAEKNTEIRVTRALSYLGFDRCDAKAVKRILTRARQLDADSVKDMPKTKGGTQGDGYSLYLPVIRVLALLSEHSAHNGLKIVSDGIQRLGYGPSDKTIWDILTEARNFRSG